VRTVRCGCQQKTRAAARERRDQTRQSADAVAKDSSEQATHKHADEHGRAEHTCTPESQENGENGRRDVKKPGHQPTAHRVRHVVQLGQNVADAHQQHCV
jgi:hypothetical protein